MNWDQLTADPKLLRFAEKWAKSKVAPTCRPWEKLALSIGSEARKAIRNYKSSCEPDLMDWPEIDWNKLHKATQKQIKVLHDAHSFLEDLAFKTDVFIIATLNYGITSDTWDDNEDLFDEILDEVFFISQRLAFFGDVSEVACEQGAKNLPALNQWRQQRINTKRKIKTRDPHARGLRSLRSCAHTIWTKQLEQSD
jgi:hypothetical protein